jgi:hypothetical protein
LWRLLAITLLAVLLSALARGMLPPGRTAWIQRWFARFRESPGTIPSVAWIALVSLLLVAPRLSNAEVPSKDLLDELAQRLSRAPECAPSCVTWRLPACGSTRDELVVRLEAHAGGKGRAVAAAGSAALGAGLGRGRRQRGTRHRRRPVRVRSQSRSNLAFTTSR